MYSAMHPSSSNMSSFYSGSTVGASSRSGLFALADPQPPTTAYPDDYKILFAHDCVPSKLPAAVRQLIVRIFEVAVVDDVDKRIKNQPTAVHLNFGGGSDQDITYNIIDATRKECVREKFNTNPDPIDVFYKHLKCKIEPLEIESDEYKMIHDYFNDGYHPQQQTAYAYTHHTHSPLLQYVFRVTRDGEPVRFAQSRYGTSKDRQLLWHGSGMTNFGGILSQGLRVAPRGAVISGAAYGAGVYFSDSVAFSSTYTRYQSYRDIGMYMVCEVADAKRATGQKRIVTERRDVCNSAGVGVPTGVNDGGAIYVAPDPAQVRMRYLVQVGYGNRQPPSAASDPLLSRALAMGSGSMQNGSSHYTTSSSNDAARSSHPILLKRSELIEMGLAKKSGLSSTSKKQSLMPKSRSAVDGKTETAFEVKRGLVEDDDCQMVAVVTKKSATESQQTASSKLAAHAFSDSGTDDVAVFAEDGLFDLADDDDYGFDVGEPCDGDD